MLLPKVLLWTAVALIAGPLSISMVAQALTWMTPGCNPNPYALGECLVGSYNLASALLLASIGGIYIMYLGAIAALPLFGLALWLSPSRKSSRTR